MSFKVSRHRSSRRVRMKCLSNPIFWSMPTPTRSAVASSPNTPRPKNRSRALSKVMLVRTHGAQSELSQSEISGSMPRADSFEAFRVVSLLVHDRHCALSVLSGIFTQCRWRRLANGPRRKCLPYVCARRVLLQPLLVLPSFSNNSVLALRSASDRLSLVGCCSCRKCLLFVRNMAF